MIIGQKGSSGNLLLNGDFNFYQRAGVPNIAGLNGVTNRWGHDRWYWQPGDVVTGNIFDGINSTVPVFGGGGIRLNPTSTPGTTYYTQTLESSDTIPLRGLPVTFSVFAAFGTVAPQIRLDLVARTDAEGLIAAGTLNVFATTGPTTVASSSVLTRYTVTGTVPSNAVTLGVRIGHVYANGTQDLIAKRAMLNVGTSAADWERALPLYQELAAVQRYFEKSPQYFLATASPGTFNGAVQFGAATTTHRDSWAQFKVLKRTTPTGYVWNPTTGNGGNIANRSSANANVAVSFGELGPGSFNLSFSPTVGSHYGYFWAADAEMTE